MAEQSALHEITAQAGVVFTEEAGWLVPERFTEAEKEYAAAHQGSALFDTSARGKIELTGPEAAFFLHNLSTNDVLNLPVGAGCEAFLATAKARIVSHLYIYHLLLHDGRPALWLDVPAGTAENVLKYLDRYLISEQVEFADRTREFAQMHLAGPAAVHTLEKALLDDVPPLENLQHMMRTFGGSDTCHIRRHDHLGEPGFDLVCLASRASNIWRMLTRAGAQPAGHAAYEILRVEAGTPALGIDMDENTFAPEVGRIPQTISYAKGCYLGQEPIVMARDRGHVNRTLLGVKLSHAPVPFGTMLYHDGKEVGRVTSSLVSPRFGPIGLAYVRRGSQDPGTVLEIEVNGKRENATVTALPICA